METVFAFAKRFARSPAFKVFLIAALVLLLTAPLAVVWLLVEDRAERAKTVKDEIASSWGGRQQIRGPFLVVYYTTEKLTGADRKVEDHRAVFLPEKLTVNGEADTQVLHRSIYDASVYKAAITLEGRFAAPSLPLSESKDVLIHWRQADVAVSVDNLAVLKETPVLIADQNRKVAFEPGLPRPLHPAMGLHARLYDLPQPPPLPTWSPEPGVMLPVPAPPNSPAAQTPVPPPAQTADPLAEGVAFKFELNFTGSASLDLLPLARDTAVTLTSNWPHPSFWGTFLPSERTLTADGFSASWHIPYVARSLPLMWNESQSVMYEVTANGGPFGARFYVPVDYYDLVNRATKYALMFVTVAFAAIFVLELVSGQSVHPVQYLFVGLAMVLFYVLLLSMSEHAGFDRAYIAASAATGGMLSVYVAAVTHRLRLGLVMAAVFAALYGLLYMILSSEGDYALLAGSLLGFVMLTVTMFATLRVKWSGDAPDQPAAAPPRLAA